MVFVEKIPVLTGFALLLDSEAAWSRLLRTAEPLTHARVQNISVAIRQVALVVFMLRLPVVRHTFQRLLTALRSSAEVNECALR